MKVLWVMSAAVLLMSGGLGKTPNPNNTTSAGTPPVSATSGQHSDVDRGGVRFQEFTRESGLQFTYHNDEEQGHFAILESMGGGGAILEFDQDGLLDILIPGGGRYLAEQVVGVLSALYRADQRGRNSLIV